MYTVWIQPSAEREAEEAYLYIRSEHPDNAARWYNGLVKTILSLEQMPHRCPLAPENDVFELEIRQLMYGLYRILFTVEGQNVHVLHIRHGARKPLEPDMT